MRHVLQKSAPMSWQTALIQRIRVFQKKYDQLYRLLICLSSNRVNLSLHRVVKGLNLFLLDPLLLE